MNYKREKCILIFLKKLGYWKILKEKMLVYVLEEIFVSGNFKGFVCRMKKEFFFIVY